MASRLTLEKREDGWWILDPNNPDCAAYGPYDTKAEAQEDKLGVTQFWKHKDDPEFWG